MTTTHRCLTVWSMVAILSFISSACKLTESDDAADVVADAGIRDAVIRDAAIRDAAMPDSSVPDAPIEPDAMTYTPWPSSTCGQGGPTGTWTRIDVGNSFYEVLAPADASGPLPLVMALHGDSGSPAIVKSYWGPAWQAQSDFIVITPQNPFELIDPDEGWDHQPDANALFLWEVLDDVATRYDIDLSRMYLTGMSAGGWFVGQRGFTFQQVFAAVQFSCGSSPSPYRYDLPLNPACKAATRFAIAADDFLYDRSISMRDALIERNHEVEFFTSPCSGHCCGGAQEYAYDAYAWFLTHTLCGAPGAPITSCGNIRDIPPPSP